MKLITRDNLLRLSDALFLAREVRSTKLAYAILKNIKKIQNEVAILRELSKSSQDFLDSESRRIELCIKYAEKDENNKPIIKNNVYIFSDENVKLFEQELKVLQEADKDIINAELKRKEDVRNFLAAEVEFDFYLIDESDFDLNLLPKNMNAVELELIEECIVKK